MFITFLLILPQLVVINFFDVILHFMNSRVKLLKSVVREAGEAIKKVSLREVSKTKMHVMDLVTKGDLESQRIIGGAISKHFPKDEILSEEVTAKKGIKDTGKYVWVIDPVDGTLNYSRGRSYYAVSVALTKKRQVLSGAVFNPLTHEFYFAEKDRGAFLNDRRIYCSKVSDPRKAMLATDNSSFIGVMRKHLSLILEFEASTAKYYITGCGTLNFCEVAAGKTDLYVHLATRPWDNAAGFLICEEAGAKISDLKGRKIDFYSPEVVVANPKLLKRFIEEINSLA